MIRVNLQVRGLGKPPVLFDIAMGMPLKKVMRAYANVHELRLGNLEFQINGGTIGGNDTAESLHINRFAFVDVKYKRNRLSCH